MYLVNIFIINFTINVLYVYRYICLFFKIHVLNIKHVVLNKINNFYIKRIYN